MFDNRQAGRTSAAVIAVIGVIVVAGLEGLHLLVPGATRGIDLEISFGALSGLACLVVLLRPVVVRSERAAWVMLGLAVAANTLSDTLAASGVGLNGALSQTASVVFGIAAFPLSIVALILMARARLGRLRAVALLDGLTGAVVLQTILAVAILAPAARQAIPSGPVDSLALLFPLADLLIIGVVAAASAEDGWRLDGWMLILLGLGLITAGDSLSAAHGASQAHAPGTTAALLWLAGVWALATSAWAPVPARTGDRSTARGWVAVSLSVIMLALLMACTLHNDHWPVTTGLAAAGMLIVTGRFALTLRLNAAVLRLARTEAATDALTGLGNRRQLTADLQVTLGRRSPDQQCGLALFDLNGFKAYNDTYGHSAGDALLATLGSQLSVAVDGSATAYRMGGDEFCVLIPSGTESPGSIVARASRALSVTTREQSVTVASGLVAMPSDAATPEEALRLADLRMYENKTQGRIGPARQVTQTLMLALEERHLGLASALDGIARLAAQIAERLYLPPRELERVQLAALLRNVGKIAIPDSLLNKPGRLTDAEWQLMRRHTVVAQRIIEAAPALLDVGKLVRSIHERVDGTGYPDGLAADQIPIEARIVAVCNAYDAMISSRAYRDPVSHHQALNELRRRAGSQFDEDVVQAFLLSIASHVPVSEPRVPTG